MEINLIQEFILWYSTVFSEKMPRKLLLHCPHKNWFTTDNKSFNLHKRQHQKIFYFFLKLISKKIFSLQKKN